MKKFICGLLIGLFMATCFVTYAGDYIVTPNPFPILVNGARQNLEAYNINSSTYIKLRDVGLATGAKVTLNMQKEQIEITTTTTLANVPTDTTGLNVMEYVKVNGILADKDYLRAILLNDDLLLGPRTADEIIKAQKGDIDNVLDVKKRTMTINNNEFTLIMVAGREYLRASSLKAAELLNYTWDKENKNMTVPCYLP